MAGNGPERSGLDFSSFFGSEPPENLVLIGMPGSGKSTVGRRVAEALSWMRMDTDRLVEAYFGASLETIKQRYGPSGVVEAEVTVIGRLAVNRCVISTGGSVVYSPAAMERLADLGRIVYLRVRLDTVRERMARLEGRGLVMGPDQTRDGLYAERIPLYERDAADVVDNNAGVEQGVEKVLALLRDTGKV